MTIKHLQSGTKLYYIWVEMRQRCSNENSNRFKLYGARGISVCEEWEDFEKFYKWSHNNGYEEGLSIDRIDNDGNYDPSNCRWVNQKEQCNNKRTNKYITYRGKTQSLMKWSKELGLNYYTLRSRARNNWTVEEMFTIPMEGRSYDRNNMLRKRK